VSSARVTEVTEPEERSQICERLLHSLPEWFGLEDAIEAYARETSSAFATSARGFRPPEETDAAWGESNPCLILVERFAV